MNGIAGINSTIACAAMYTPGETPEIMKDGGTPSRGPEYRRAFSMFPFAKGLRANTYDGLSSKLDSERGTCISQEGPLFHSKFVPSSASLVLSAQVFLDLPQSEAKTERGYQFKRADLKTEPSERCYRFKSIAVEVYEWLERHNSGNNLNGKSRSSESSISSFYIIYNSPMRTACTRGCEPRHVHVG